MSPATTTPQQSVFRQLLLNTLIAGVTSTFLWFAITFWVYLETRSVVATSVIGGAFALAAAITGVALGTYVDRHRKHQAMLLSTNLSVAFFACAAVVYGQTWFGPLDHGDLLEFRAPWFWLLAGLTLAGAVVGNMRGVAMATCVTVLVAEEDRAKANGQVGTITGVSFAITSVFSGLVVGLLGMGWAYVIAVGLMVVCAIHLSTVKIPGDVPAPADHGAPRFDVAGARSAIRAVPGLMLLILFAAFNNFLGGVFMSLMDPYGLELVSVEVWGVLWGVLSLGFIVGGLIVARRGLGPRPLRVILIGNLVNWTVCSLFALQASIVMLSVGMFIWLVSIPIIEAAEQTVLQQAIPFEMQGRVFGFAQTIETAATPLTSLMIGPIAERVFMPFMTDGRGADWIGGWFGTGPGRGLALVFTLAGLVGVLVTLFVRVSPAYRRLNRSLTAAAAGSTQDDPPVVDSQATPSSV